ncbi:Putative phage integrase [Mycobacteroides abscessus subsp. abscessus]|nr:Putative phage integrase [Mycobacteroides abscessus subsp. abscessus]
MTATAKLLVIPISSLTPADKNRYRSMHSARHTTSTLLNKARVSQETRMKVVGHSTAAAHQGYVHVDHETARAALSNLNELLD